MLVMGTVAVSSAAQLPVGTVSSLRLSSELKSAFTSSASAFPRKSSSSLHVNFQPSSSAGSTQTLVRASVSSAGAAALKEGNLSKVLEGIQVCDPTGARVSLTSLWENRKAVVAFGRHFGCMLCRKRAGLLEARKAEMDAAGVALVLIAPGVPEQARGFLQHNKFTGEVYADPEYAAYEALDFKKGFMSVVNPKSGQRVIQAQLDGYGLDWELSMNYKDTIEKGSWLQGGILVAGPGKDTVHYLFKDAEAGDEPNMEDLMAACCKS